MKKWKNLFALLCPLFVVYCKDVDTSTISVRLPIVFVYTVVPAICSKGLPKYIKESLSQAMITQPDCDVVMASNYAECSEIEKELLSLPGLIKFDTTKFISNRTIIYQNASLSVFQHDNRGELWMTSALRFFIMEDLMISLKYNEILHIEADNLIYGRLTSILKILRDDYKGIAATPLTANKSFITASVFWVSNQKALTKFNNFLLDLALNNHNMWWNYLAWLRKYACCKPGGLAPDSNGNGIKPFAVNEMSMLGYYHQQNSKEFKLLPVVPKNNHYYRNRHVCDIASFSSGGYSVGAATGHGIWDSNSWGQYIGGTSVKKGRDKGFSDFTHISGQAIRTIGCKIAMLCSNQSLFETSYDIPYKTKYNFSFVTDEHLLAAYKPAFYNQNLTASSCYTSPFVTCGTALVAEFAKRNETLELHWTPLWNLHVHSKHTFNYRSLPCDCEVVV